MILPRGHVEVQSARRQVVPRALVAGVASGNPAAETAGRADQTRGAHVALSLHPAVIHQDQEAFVGSAFPDECHELIGGVLSSQAGLRSNRASS